MHAAEEHHEVIVSATPIERRHHGGIVQSMKVLLSQPFWEATLLSPRPIRIKGQDDHTGV